MSTCAERNADLAAWVRAGLAERKDVPGARVEVYFQGVALQDAAEFEFPVGRVTAHDWGIEGRDPFDGRVISAPWCAIAAVEFFVRVDGPHGPGCHCDEHGAPPSGGVQ